MDVRIGKYERRNRSYRGGGWDDRNNNDWRDNGSWNNGRWNNSGQYSNGRYNSRGRGGYGSCDSSRGNSGRRNRSGYGGPWSMGSRGRYRP